MRLRPRPADLAREPVHPVGGLLDDGLEDGGRGAIGALVPRHLEAVDLDATLSAESMSGSGMKS